MGNNNQSCGVEKTKLIKHETKESKIDEKKMQKNKIEHEKDMAKTTAKIQAIEKSLNTDPSIPNAVEQMATLIELEGSPMGQTLNVIAEMQDQWNAIDNHLNIIEPVVGKEEVSDLKTLRTNYFILLAETKPIIAGLIEQSSSKIEDITATLAVIDKAINNSKYKKGQLSEADKLFYKEGIESLRRWIDQSKLAKLVGKWTEMAVKLKAKESKWEAQFTSYYEKFNKQSKWKKVGLFFAGVAIAAITIGACVAFVIATAGVGAAAIVGVGAVASGFIVGSSIGGAVGLTGLAAALIYGHQKKKQNIHESLKRIQNMINGMLDTSNTIKSSIVEINVNAEKIEARFEELNNTEILIKMKRNLNSILGYLQNYNEQGQNVMNACDETVVKFLKR
eukprot:358664_1